MSNVDQACALLQALEYTEYEADALVTLLELSSATASELADRSSVPRSRVYDVMEDLADRGFVEICEGDPREFRAVPPETITETLYQQYDEHLGELDDVLRAVDRTGVTEPERCRVWSLQGREQTLGRGQELLADAEAEIVAYTTAELLESGCFDHFGAAVDRGVDVTVLAADDCRDWFAESLAGATVTTPPDWLDDEPLVRVFVVDRRACQVATRWQATPTTRPEIRSVLATGEANGFVLALAGTLAAAIDAD